MPNVIAALLNGGGDEPLRADMSSLQPAKVDNIEEMQFNKRHSGIQGVARDILGGLGDLVLSRLRMGTPYSTNKRNAQLNFAAQGLDSDNPNDVMNAVNNIQKIDFATGVKLRDQIIDNQRLQAAQDTTAEGRATRLQLLRAATGDKYKANSAAYMNAIANADPDKRPALYARQRQIILNSPLAKTDPQFRAELESLYPETYDENAITAAISGSVPVAQQWSKAQRDQQISNQEEQFDKRINTTIRGQDLAHQDRVAGREAADARAAAGRAAAAARAGGKPQKPRPTASDINFLQKYPQLRNDFDGRFGLGASDRILGKRK